MRKIIIILSGCSVVLLLAYAGYRGYEVWKQNHWLSLAKQFAAKMDMPNEFLALEQVLQANSRNVEATRMMANLAEAERSPAALSWRKKVVEFDPNSLNDQLALVQTAIFARDLDLASSVLAGVGAKNAEYYNLAGELSLEQNRPADAQTNFAEAARLDPSDPAILLSLAVVQLHRTNTLDSAEARIMLKRIAGSTNFVIRSQAERELIMDALRHQDYPTALWYSKDLTQSTNTSFVDKLLRLNALKTSQNPEFGSAIAACEREAATNSVEIEQFSLWLKEQSSSADALKWLRSLPLATQTNLPAAPLIAQCQMNEQDWNSLQSSASKQNWGGLEYARHAYIARALRQQGLEGAGKAEWDVAVKAANGQDDLLTALYQMASQWNWRSEAQQLLWNIVNGFPQEQWAPRELIGQLYASGGTRPLFQLFGIESSRNPSDLDAKNNVAMTAMLLRANEVKPYDLAQEVYQKAPTNSNYACTYAFALYLQGQNSEALKIMQSIAPQNLDDYSVAGYYGLILKAAGDKRAGAFLKRSLAGALLPEERAMFQQAMTGL